MGRKKKNDVAVENKNVETAAEELKLESSEGGLINDLLNNTQVSEIMLTLMKTAIPNLTCGAISPREIYYDKKKGATIVEIDVHGEAEYLVSAEIKIDGAWVVDLKIKNLSTGLIRRFNYTEGRVDDDE